jgi:hypothetical protein
MEGFFRHKAVDGGALRRRRLWARTRPSADFRDEALSSDGSTEPSRERSRCFSPSRTDLFGSEIWPKLAWFWFAIHVAHLRTQKPTS